jgi:hypothetical protein
VRGHILILKEEEEGAWAREGESKQLRQRASSGPDLARQWRPIPGPY